MMTIQSISKQKKESKSIHSHSYVPLKSLIMILQYHPPSNPVSFVVNINFNLIESRLIPELMSSLLSFSSNDSFFHSSKDRSGFIEILEQVVSLLLL